MVTLDIDVLDALGFFYRCFFDERNEGFSKNIGCCQNFDFHQ